MADRKKFRLEPEFLQRWGNALIFCLLLFVEILLLFGNWNSVHFNNIRAWWVLLPVCAFLAAENAVKIWMLRAFREKIACYVLDTLCLIVLTVFSDGSLISTLYIIILSEFYLGQKNIAGSIAMGAASIVLFLVAFAISGALKDEPVQVTSLIAGAFNDILLMALHFFGFNLAIQIWRKNRELRVTSEELGESNRKLSEAYDELNASNKKLREAYKELQEVTALEERQRIAKDIHDTAGHSITTIIMQTEAAKLVIDSDPEDAKRKIAAANLQARNALEELRESVHLLSGASEQLTLREMLLSIVHESTDGTGIVIRTDIDEIELCKAKQRFLCNTLKEGISNGLRHGNATAFYFELKQKGDKIAFLLSDNGSGMDQAKLRKGFGLKGMYARAEALGGSVRCETEPDEGFEIRIDLPADNP
ncbi:MAG TPA: sensor histidine kinase [Firmicutes bacterium]|nr:sensor histidine kinase [Bacillota bacterium]